MHANSSLRGVEGKDIVVIVIVHADCCRMIRLLSSYLSDSQMDEIANESLLYRD